MNQTEIKKLIKKLKKDTNVNTLSVNNPIDENYYYYYSINGFLKDDYFSFYFIKFKPSKRIKECLSSTSDNAIGLLNYFNLNIEIK